MKLVSRNNPRRSGRLQYIWTKERSFIDYCHSFYLCVYRPCTHLTEFTVLSVSLISSGLDLSVEIDIRIILVVPYPSQLNWVPKWIQELIDASDILCK